MAIYSLHSGFVSRSTGRSSVQAAAYICGEKLQEDRREKIADFTNKSNGVACYKTIVPEHSKYKDISLWNEVENFEDRYAEAYFKAKGAKENYLNSAQTAMSMVIALPNEFSTETNRELLEQFINMRFTSRNLITTYAIHEKEGNTHAHLQITRRAIGEDGEFLKRKDREICTKAALFNTRKLWADLANEALSREGFNERITEKSYADLGINLEGTKHKGWHANQLGFDSRITQENFEIYKRNEERILSDPNIIIDVINEKKAVFTQRDMLTEINNKIFDESNVAAVFEKVLEESIYVGESIRGDFLYTGKRYQQLEGDVLSKFDTMCAQTAGTTCKEETVASALGKYNYLSSEQKEAVIGLTKDSNFGILLGKAGAGKTTAMRAISDIYKDSGSRVIGMSISALASDNLGVDAGIDSATIASWEYRWKIYKEAQEAFASFDSVIDKGLLKHLGWYNDLCNYEQYQLNPGDVIIVDEAGMVGTKEWKVILDAAEKFSAKVIAVGDDNQFKPISAGDSFRQFLDLCSTKVKPEAAIASDVGEDKHRSIVCELKEIRRQKEDWQKEASIEFSNLSVGEALVKYEDHERLHAVKEWFSSEERSSLYNEVAKKYLEIEKLGTGVVLCSTNNECALINNKVRILKKKVGEIGEDIININGRNFAENDRIMFLENNKQIGVKNGQCGTVYDSYTTTLIFNNEKINMLVVDLDDGTQLEIDTSQYNKIDHAYATTLHKSQGKTYDNTVLVVSKQGVMDAKSMYVGMTRHKENVDVYYSQDDFRIFKELVKYVSKSNHKDALLDYSHAEISGNVNKERVFEYQSIRLELSCVLNDIKTGESSWKEYNELKANKISLEKELLSSYDSCKVYLSQLGITKEMLEESSGVRERTKTRAEQNAKSNVLTYIAAVQKSRELFDEIDSETLTKSEFREHPLYEKFMKVREIRTESAKEINRNYPLHREFVDIISKQEDFFICERTIGAHASPSSANDDFKLDDATKANINVSLYARCINKMNEIQEKMKAEVGEDGDITKHKNYSKYQIMSEKKDNYGRRIAKNMKIHEQALVKYESKGITKESIEDLYGKYIEQDGRMERVLNDIERAAKNTVLEYAKVAKETSDLYKQIKDNSYNRNIKKCKDYGRYCDIREHRNSLAEKILLNPSTYREFIEEKNEKEKSKEDKENRYIISFKNMNRQVDYGRSLKEEAQLEARKHLERQYKPDIRIKEELDTDVRQEETKAIVSDLISGIVKSMNVNEVLKHQSEKSINEKQKIALEAISSLGLGYNASLEKTEVKATSANSLEALLNNKATMKVATKENSISSENSEFRGTRLEERMSLDRNAHNYYGWMEEYKERHGYSLHVSQGMLLSYCSENNLKEAKNLCWQSSIVKEYASIIAQQKLDVLGQKEITLEIAQDCIKQAICFKALHGASGEKSLTPPSIQELHQKAEILSQHITKENLHVLENKEVIKQAYDHINNNQEKLNKQVKQTALTEQSISRIISLDQKDLESQLQNQELSKDNQLHNSIHIDKSREMEIGM